MRFNLRTVSFEYTTNEKRPDVLFAGVDIMVKQLAPLWTASAPVSRRIDQDKSSWGKSNLVKIQSPSTTLDLSSMTSDYSRILKTHTGFLLVFSRFFRLTTAFKRVDFPTFARPKQTSSTRLYSATSSNVPVTITYGKLCNKDI